ncbi:unnamed protein product [Clonostachys solani]|uniref:Uncharacterized protein n=1 Tax=Clonostachys solani TaxID=160281 RepID=A0A9N9W7J1_9HYPO|nr:unnamed protein product [Clonostachys solani]
MGSDTMKDLIAGAAGGVAQVMIDIVKVRLQAYGGQASTVARNVLRKEGPLAFYKVMRTSMISNKQRLALTGHKGTLTPLVGVGACVSIQFGGFHYFRSLLECSRGTTSLSLFDYYCLGGAAGLANSVISGPIEHIRIRLQTQPHGDKRLYSGPVDCLRKITGQAGLAGVWRGQAVTLLREFHGYGVWFAAYEGLVHQLINYEKKPRTEIPSWKFAVCGGLAGELLWLLSHPLDVIKSKMQSDGFGKDQRYRTMGEAFRITFRSGGMPALWEGLGTALLRALPVSAGTFAA